MFFREWNVWFVQMRAILALENRTFQKATQPFDSSNPPFLSTTNLQGSFYFQVLIMTDNFFFKCPQLVEGLLPQLDSLDS